MGFDLFKDVFNPLGKAVTRALTPSDQQLKALNQLVPMVTGIAGAATGNQFLAATGAAFGGRGSDFNAATSPLLQHQYQMAALQAQGNPYAMGAAGGASPAMSQQTQGGFFDESQFAATDDGDDTVLWLAGGVAAAILIWAVSRRR